MYMSTACGWLLFVQYASCVYMDVRTPTHMCMQVHIHRGEIKERENSGLLAFRLMLFNYSMGYQYLQKVLDEHEHLLSSQIRVTSFW